MTSINFYKETVNFEVNITNVNGSTFDEYKETMDLETVENIESNLKSLNLNFDNFCIYDSETGVMKETWDNIDLNILVNTDDVRIDHAVLQLDSKYSQLSTLSKEKIKNGKCTHKLSFYRARWGGPVRCVMFFNDKDGNLVSHSQQILFYTDERDKPNLISGLFSFYKDNFSQTNSNDSKNWKKITKKLKATNQIFSFDYEKPGQKKQKIAIWWNSKIEKIDYFYRIKPKNLKNRGTNSGIFGLLYLSSTIGPFMVVLHNVIKNINKALNTDESTKLKLREITNNNNTYNIDQKNEYFKTNIKEILESEKILEEVKYLAQNLYSEDADYLLTTEAKVIQLLIDAIDNDFEIFQRGQLAYQKAFEANSWIDKNLKTGEGQ